MPPLSKPHLPEAFVKKILADPELTPGYTSLVFQEAGHLRRLGMVSIAKEDCLSPDSHVFPTVPGQPPSPLRTTAHLAAAEADPLLLCEAIRLGVTIDLPNHLGATPMYMAFSCLLQCMKPLRGTVPLSEPVSHHEAKIRRYIFVIRTLIEQHADITLAVKGATYLHFACIAASWELIALLIAHGVNTSPLTPPPGFAKHPADLLDSAADKARYHALVAERASAPRARPHRLCPCFSGKTLAACHNNLSISLTYPLEFICKCGSAKTYAKCCRRRDIILEERWDDREQWIGGSSQRVLNVPLSVLKQARDMEDLGAQLRGSLPFLSTQGLWGGGPPNPVFDEAMKRGRMTAAVEMCAKGIADHAYGYALRRVDFIPRPQGRGTSKFTCAKWKEQWNAAVDEYIDLGTDPRPREDIERASKIGLSGGALYRKCEGVGCTRAEGRDSANFNVCSKCKIAVYCGRKCQTSAWAAHKRVCGNSNQHEQALPSQIAFDEYMLPKLAAEMARSQ
ncbi:hypothetical protein PLICRDRAFT_178304 [Plicaturopsis crispa FD-325 SS-3]|nr:hypothetical protein PLICRDRAFT_178304 [Plicaturopsis crispa FD-325 SS-3]